MRPVARSSASRPAVGEAGGGRGLLLVLSANMLLDALEVSVVVVALPPLSRDLDLGPAAAAWVMAAFAVGFGASLPLTARLVARLGRRRVYLAGLVGFAAASVAAGLAPSAGLLVASRLVKGVCVALTAPTGLSIVAASYEEGPARNRAVATYAMFGASGFAAGLLLSGLLTSASWRWTFFFPAPAALVLLPFGLRAIPRDSVTAPRAPGVGAALAGGSPLLRSALGAAAFNGSWWGFLLTLSFALQWERGWTPLRVALVALPASALLAAATPLAPRMLRRFGTAGPIAAGAACGLAGYAWYLAAGAGSGRAADVLPTIVLVGVGFVLAFAALQVQAVSAVPRERQGAVTAAYQASVQLGGAAVLVLVAAGGGHAPLVILAVAGLGLAIALAGLVGTRPGPGGAGRPVS
jgi:MFS family permease